MKEKDLYQSTLALGFGIVAIIAAFLESAAQIV